jgi:hypothetical protein
MFALYHKKLKKFMGFYTVSNEGGEFCVGTQHHLSTCSECVWVVTSKEVAQKAAKTSTEWYNAGYSTPVNQYAGELEVVELKAK